MSVFNYKDFEETLVEVLGEITNETVIIANQNAPRPSMPYFTAQLMSFNSLGETEELRSQTETVSVLSWGELTIQIKAVGMDSFERALECKSKIQLRQYGDRLFVHGAGMGRLGNVIDAPIIRQNGFELQSVFEVTFNIASIEDENLGYIETAEIAGTINQRPITV
jgi:hypothetical protein